MGVAVCVVAEVLLACPRSERLWGLRVLTVRPCGVVSPARAARPPVAGGVVCCAVALLVAAIFIIKNKNSNSENTEGNNDNYVYYGEDNDIEDTWDIGEWS